MNEFFKENHKLIFQEWISPSELKNASILDLGSQTGWLGEYCMLHGASNYVGVEIDKFHIDDAKANYPNLTFYHMDLEDYVRQCVDQKSFFDIVVISRTIHGVLNQVTLLQNLSKITNKVVIETGVPINSPAHKLLEILKSVNLSNDYKEQVKKVSEYIEYQQPFVDYIHDDRFIHLVPSIGFFKEVFEKLGFELSLDTYESVKQKYPDEYGYDVRPEADQQMKKSILKFTKVRNTSKPLSWKEWDDIKDL